jgi:hypothetical protein
MLLSFYSLDIDTSFCPPMFPFFCCCPSTVYIDIYIHPTLSTVASILLLLSFYSLHIDTSILPPLFLFFCCCPSTAYMDNSICPPLSTVVPFF